MRGFMGRGIPVSFCAVNREVPVIPAVRGLPFIAVVGSLRREKSNGSAFGAPVEAVVRPMRKLAVTRLYGQSFQMAN